MWTRLRFGAGAVTIFQCGGNIRGPCTIGGACASSLSSEPLHLLSITSLATTISCQPEHCDYLEYNFKPLARLQQIDSPIQQHRQYGSPNQDLARRHLPRGRTTVADNTMEQPPLDLQRHVRQVRRLRQQKSRKSEHHRRGKCWLDDPRPNYTN